MPTFQARGGQTRAIVRIKGHKSVSKTFPTKTAAKQWAAKVESDMGDGNHFNPGKSSTGDLIKRYLTDREDLDKWASNRLKRMAREERWVDLPILQCQDAIQAWVEKRRKEVSSGTVRRELVVLSGMFTFAMKRWRIKLRVHPIRDIERPPKPKGRKRRVKAGEVAAFWQHFGQPGEGPTRVKDYVPWMFEFACETGLRLEELTEIEWATTDLEARTVYVPPSKNGDERHALLTVRAVEILESLRAFQAAAVLAGTKRRPGGVFPVNKLSIGTEFRTARNTLGLVNLHFHDSRHEACTSLAKFLSVMELASVIGHRDLRSLMVYYNPTPAELAAKLPGNAQPTPPRL